MPPKTNKTKQTVAQVQEFAAQLEQQLAQIKQAMEQQLLETQQSKQQQAQAQQALEDQLKQAREAQEQQLMEAQQLKQQQAQAQQALEDQLKQAREAHEQQVAQALEANEKHKAEVKLVNDQLSAAVRQQRYEFETLLEDTRRMMQTTMKANSEQSDFIAQALKALQDASKGSHPTPPPQAPVVAFGDSAQDVSGQTNDRVQSVPPGPSHVAENPSVAVHLPAPSLQPGWSGIARDNPYMIPPTNSSARGFSVPSFTNVINAAGTGSAQDPITVPHTPAPLRPVLPDPTITSSPANRAQQTPSQAAQPFFALPPGLQTVKLPEPFNGSGDFRSFRGDFQRCAIANNWDEATQIRTIASCLTGYAGNTYLAWHSRGELSNLTMAQLWNKMEHKFYDAEADTEEAKRKLRARKQKPNETIDAYVEVFLNLAAEANVTDKKLVRQFKDNILPSLVTPVATALATDKDIDFKTAVAIVREMESSTLKTTHVERKRKLVDNSDEEEELRNVRRVHAIGADGEIDTHDVRWVHAIGAGDHRNSGVNQYNQNPVSQGEGTRSSSDIRRLDDTIADIQRQLAQYRQCQQQAFQGQYVPPPMQQAPTPDQSRRRPFQGTCFKCGVQGHTANDCRYQGKYCRFCDRRGHTADECRKPKPPQANAPKDANPQANSDSRQGN
jgi:hypothetical protein